MAQKIYCEVMSHTIGAHLSLKEVHDGAGRDDIYWTVDSALLADETEDNGLRMLWSKECVNLVTLLRHKKNWRLLHRLKFNTT